MVKTTKKQEHDKKRTEWRKKHRTLNGRIILYPNKDPEHINARGSKAYNWFWKRILLDIEPQEIPAVISGIKNQMKAEKDAKKIRLFRTMIVMAEDAYQLKKLEDIKDYDMELQLGEKPIYDSESGVILQNGKYFTTDFNEDEEKILLRDIEGVIIDAIYANPVNEKLKNSIRNENYRNWKYMEKKKFANK